MTLTVDPTTPITTGTSPATSTSSSASLVEQVRQMLETARAEGRPLPGRSTVMADTGATDYQAKVALVQARAELDAENATDASPAAAGLHPAPEAAGVEPGGGRAVAWIGLVFGALSSLAANWLHTWLPAAHQPPGWTPGLAPQIGAMVWPLALLLAVEVVSRVRWPHGWTWWVARFGGAGLVAAGSALISYGHLRAVLVSWQYSPIEAAVGPLVLDGLMTVCGVALLADSNHRDRPNLHQHRQFHQGERRPLRLTWPLPLRRPWIRRRGLTPDIGHTVSPSG